MFFHNFIAVRDSNILPVVDLQVAVFAISHH